VIPVSEEKPEEKRFKVMFLCTGNSARSIFAEYLLRKLDRRRFEAFSAGSQPRGEVHPLTLQVLRDNLKIDASDARSKSWEEFQDVQLDFVITVCDNARESCPIWPGQPIVAHWGVPDPAAAEGAEEHQLQAFKEAAIVLSRRIELFVNLPFEKLDRLRLEQLTREIGAPSPVPSPA
jgi:protein-tyrosine-phosphatase